MPAGRLLASAIAAAMFSTFGARAAAFELPSVDLRPIELESFDTRTPEIAFDVPRELLVRDVTTDAFRVERPGERLFEVVAPVTLVLYHGEAERVRDVVIEIDGGAAGLRVHDYAPRTEVAAELARPIEVKQTHTSDRSFGASLGGKLAGDAALTPTVSGGTSSADTRTETRSVLAPKRAVIVSGAINGRTGVFFKLRSTSQGTLEGERPFRVTFAARADWDGGDLAIRCVARGEKKWLFVEQRRVWNETSRPVSLRLVSHTVAKPNAE
ncbi:MAG: hypothetical protein AAF805_14525 [Planctomycetota bacterium]